MTDSNAEFAAMFEIYSSVERAGIAVSLPEEAFDPLFQSKHALQNAMMRTPVKDLPQLAAKADLLAKMLRTADELDLVDYEPARRLIAHMAADYDVIAAENRADLLKAFA